MISFAGRVRATNCWSKNSVMFLLYFIFEKMSISASGLLHIFSNLRITGSFFGGAGGETTTTGATITVGRMKGCT